MNNKRKQNIFFKGNIINLLFSIIASILVSASNLSIAWVLQNVIDYISKNNDLTFIQLIIVAIISFALMGVSIVIDYIFSPRFSATAIKNYKHYVFSKILNKSSDSFFEENTATYLSLLSNDIEKIKNEYLDQINAFVEILLTLVGALVMMILSSPLLALISLVISMVPLLFSIRVGKSIPKKEKDLSEKNAKYVSFIKDALSGFSVIKSFKAEERVLNNHESYNSQQIDALKSREKTIIAVGSTSHLLGNITQISIFIVCAALVGKIQNLTPGTVVLFIQLMNFVIRPIEQLPKILAGRKGVIGLLEAHELLINKNVIVDGNQVLKEKDNNIFVRNVSYSYGENNIVLKNIDADFASGKCYLIVGDSGSGKTTLLNLLSGVRQDYDGSIKYGDLELKNISRNALYNFVSIIQQNVYIFNDTIKNNITMYETFSDDEIKNAISLTGLDKLIKEKGNEYICGEGGNLLSGGEKQRISIARSILRKQKVLFIDEGTSALDIESAKKINQAILNMKETTRFIISHSMDMNLVHECDEIVVIRNGQIAEKGNFNELIAHQSYFYALYLLSSK